MASTWNFFPDRDTIIKAALRRIRAYDPEDTSPVTTNQYNNASETLNMLLSAWQADGLQVWCVKTSSALTMTAGTTSYTIGNGATFNLNRPLDIMQAWIRDTTSNADTPMMIISKEVYNNLTAKTTTGTPNQLYYDAAWDGATNTGTTSTGTIYLWPAADATIAAGKRLYIVYQRPLLDFTATSDALDMPQEWYNAVRLNLALAIAPEYGIPVIEYDRLKGEAMEAKELAMGWDREKTSIYFQPYYGA